MKLRIIKYYSSLLLLFLMSGCLDDAIQPELNVSLEDGAEILRLIESRGDFINSDSMPSLVTAAELFANLSNYLIIDVRDSLDYILGHIQNSINIKPSELLNHFESQNVASYSKIVYVSKTGEAASYYNAMFRFLGYENVYALRFGMASWHNDFADIWKNSLGNFRDSWKFTNRVYEKDEYSDLPAIEFTDLNLSVDEKLRLRILSLLNNGFKEQTVVNAIISPKVISNSNALLNDDPTITIFDIYNNFRELDSTFGNTFILCFGQSQIYYPYGGAGSHIEYPGHPPQTVWYRFPIFPDTRTISFLQTIPSDQPIAIYSEAGHKSAFLTAFLRVLGYDAKSINFGAHNFHYTPLSFAEQFGIIYFRESYIMDYPYISGN